jgi:hypothetical protein
MSAAAPGWRLDKSAGAGVRWIAAGEVELLCAAGRDAGLHCVRVDLGGCPDKAALLARLASALRFPAWFGHNWDALADCLDDLSWLPGSGYLLVLEDSRRFYAAAPRDYQVMLEILADAAGAWRTRALPFWAFISMAAPCARRPYAAGEPT